MAHHGIGRLRPDGTIGGNGRRVVRKGVAVSGNGRGPQPHDRSEGQAHRPPIARGDERALWAIVAVLAGLIIAWVGVIFAVEPARFVLFGPRAQAAGIEVASALARLFAALVLLLFPDTRTRPRLSWVAAGFLVLGLGWLVFGYLLPLLGRTPDLNASMYASLLVWTVAGILFVVGLLPPTPPWPSPPLSCSVHSAWSSAPLMRGFRCSRTRQPERWRRAAPEPCPA